MKRFFIAYLTVMVVVVVFVNLLLIFLYSNRYIFHAAEVGDNAVVGQPSFLQTLIGTNLFLAGLFLVIWLLSRKIYSINYENIDAPKKKETKNL